ncbi:MAG: homoserine dehydrogenase [Clostridia bacterium]|nr:homoserine dehydrogenase [Clostridia bacterium]
MSEKSLKVALLGFGVVGSGTAEVITENQDRIRLATGGAMEIRYILDLRDFPDSPFADRIVHDYNIILNDPEVDAVVEMMGGSHPAYEFTKSALMAGKHVVTSNKEVVANFGTELLSIAAEHGVRYLFEASVGGGIPVLRPLAQDMAANRVRAVNGILNGTTNYILTAMKSGASFDEVLARAQELGYAERNPSADVDGPDAARKIVILTAMSTGLRVDPNTIPMEGIRNIKNEDVAVAESCGCAIKLIGHMGFVEDKLSVWVAPCFVPEAHPLNHIDDVFNGVLIDTDMLGQTLFYGRGAGKLPTAGAVVSDLTDIATHPYDADTAMRWVDATPDQIAPAGAEKLSVCLIYDKGAEPSQDGALQYVDTGDRKAVILPPMTTDEIEATVAKGAARPVAQYRVLPL